MKMNKKGNIGMLYPAVLSIVLVAIILAIGLVVLSKFKGTLTANSEEANATGSTITALGDIGDTWMVVIVTAVAAAVILGLIIGGFGGARKAR